MTSAISYRYDRFRLRHMLGDMRFAPAGPRPGSPLPVLDLVTLTGERITLEGLDRPHLFVFGSNTWPMTVSAAPGLADLHRRFGDRVEFVLVQVREAHPGELTPQATTFEGKVELARRLRLRLGVPFTVAVDDAEGTFHRALDPKPNAAYLVGSDGTIVFRAQWAGDIGGLRAALAAVVEGRPPGSPQSTRMLGPILRALGHIDDVVGLGGRQARRDLRRSAAPMAAMGRASALFGWMPPGRRGPAAMVTLGILAVVLTVLVVSLG